jgi:hypothetical protein
LATGTKLYLKEDKTCVEATACPAGTWAKVSATPATATVGTCEKCTTGCAKCAANADFITEECSECTADLGFWHDATKKTCTACVTNCKTCTSATVCSACKDDTFTLSSDGTKCEAAGSSGSNKLTVGLTIAAVAGYILA